MEIYLKKIYDGGQKFRMSSEDDAELSGQDSDFMESASSAISYARSTLPDQFEIKLSSIPDAGYGVFAKECIGKDLKFGPYEGKKISVDKVDEYYDNSYVWEIMQENKVLFCLDGKDENKGNWLRFINCARTREEQNMTAFQHNEEIYYRSFKEVPAGTELLVWYGNHYAGSLGITLNTIIGDFGLPCPYCNVDLASEIHLQKHMDTCSLKCYFEAMSSNPAPKPLESQNDRISHPVSPPDNGMPRSNEPDKEDPSYCSSPGTSSGLSYSSTCDGLQCNKPKKVIRYARDGPYTCSYCAKEFKYATLRDVHVRVHTGERPCVCKECGKGFKQPSALAEHVRTHTGERPFACKHCGKAFASKSTANKHELIHSDYRAFGCEVCGKRFKRASHLKDHACSHNVVGRAAHYPKDKQKMLDRPKPFICRYCGKQFHHVGHLRCHFIVHTGEKNFTCDHCGKSFARKSTLTKHVRNHTGETPYVCNQCNRGFKSAGSLSDHMVTHGDKPFNCCHCDKAFYRERYLRAHQKIHFRHRQQESRTNPDD